MPFLTEEALQARGFRKLGRQVRVSDRAAIYDADQIEIGDYSRIDDFCVVSGRISIGRNVHVTVMCNLAGGSPGIVMEDFSVLAYGVHVFTQSDDYSGKTMTNSTVPAKYKNETKLPVRLGRHVIVGCGSIIMPGVEIAEGCSVGAGSLLLRSTTPWGIYAGSPAKRLKDRARDLLALEAEYLAADGEARS